MNGTSVPWDSERFNEERLHLAARVVKLAGVISNYVGSQNPDRWSYINAEFGFLRMDSLELERKLDEIGRRRCDACGFLLSRGGPTFFHPHIHGEDSS